jgi:hypothetical protein
LRYERSNANGVIPLRLSQCCERLDSRCPPRRQRACRHDDHADQNRQGLETIQPDDSTSR